MTLPPGNRNRPQYFHLLCDEEIERLREVLQSLHQRERDVLNRWHQLYTVHFGEATTLSQREFMSLYGHDLKQTVTHLLQGDMERFVLDLRETGEQLVERGVPFREVVWRQLTLRFFCVSSISRWHASRSTVITAYQEYRGATDIIHELSFLLDQLNDDVGPITRGS